MPLQLLVLQALQLNPSAPVMSTQEAMGYGYMTKRQMLSKETGLHIALQWNEVREADVSCEECCRTKCCEHVSTDLYWLNSNASRAGPVISVILFYLFSQEQGKSRQPLRLLAVLLPLLLQNESRHARISQEPNCSKNALKQESQRNQHEPTLTYACMDRHWLYSEHAPEISSVCTVI